MAKPAQCTSIVVYATDEAPDPRASQYPPPSSCSCSYCDLLSKSPTLIGNALRLYLLILSVEDVAVCVVVITGIAPVNMMLFMFTILLQTILLIRALHEAERHKGVREVRLYQWDIKAKFCLVAAGAWFPPAWWFLEMLGEFRGRRNRAECWGCRHPVNHERAAIAAAAFAFHLLLAIVVMRVMWWGCSSLLRRLLKPAVIKAGHYADLPETAFKNDGKCAICLSAFKEEDSVLHLPCRHIFHGKCLCQWLERSETCPMRCSGAVLQLPPTSSNKSSLGRALEGSPADAETGDEEEGEEEEEEEQEEEEEEGPDVDAARDSGNDEPAEETEALQVDSELESLGEDTGLMELQAFDEPQPVTLGMLRL